MSLSQPKTLVPPVVPWWPWYVTAAGRLRQGQHLLFVGPTQTGKTTLCRYVASLRKWVVVFGTKPTDPSLDEYVADGYHRIDHWPPTREDYRKGGFDRKTGPAYFILWPKIKARADLRRFTNVYSKCLEDVFVDGRWAVVVDEALWVAGKKGLDLGDVIADTAYGSASNLVSLYVLMQRPSGIPRIIWSSVAEAFIFHGGVTNDVRELASLGTYPPRDVQQAIQQLRGHQFLDLPLRGGTDWSISEVVKNGR